MEQSTMLDPSNNFGGPQFENDEEMREISYQLSKVKKKHDYEKQKKDIKMSELDRINKEIQQLNVLQQNLENSTYETSTKIEQLKTAIHTTKEKCDEEDMNTHVHHHMMNRLKRDLISYQVQKKDLEKALR
jgi:chromosome segregation ATPase